MRKFVQEVTFYCTECSHYTTIIVTSNVKLKNIKCSNCKAEYESLRRVKA